MRHVAGVVGLVAVVAGCHDKQVLAPPRTVIAPAHAEAPALAVLGVPALAGGVVKNHGVSPRGGWARIDDVLLDVGSRAVVRMSTLDATVVFAPDDAHAVVVDERGTAPVVLIALPSGRVVRSLGTTRSYRWSPAGRFLVWTDDAVTSVFDTRTETVRAIDTGHVDAPTFDLDDGLVVFDLGGSPAHELRVFSLVDGSRLLRVMEPRPSTWAFDREGQRVVLADIEIRPKLRSFELRARGDVVPTPLGVTIPSYEGICTSTGTWEVAEASPARIRLQRDCSGRDYADVDPKRRTTRLSTETDGDGIGALKADADAVLRAAHLPPTDGVLMYVFAKVRGKSVLFYGSRRGILVLDPSGHELAVLPGSPEHASSFVTGNQLVVSTSGTTAVFVDEEGRAHVWDLRTFERVWSSVPRPEAVLFGMRSRNGDLVTVSRRGTLRRWRPDGVLVHTLLLPSAVPSGCAPEAIDERAADVVRFGCTDNQASWTVGEDGTTRPQALVPGPERFTVTQGTTVTEAVSAADASKHTFPLSLRGMYDVSVAPSGERIAARDIGRLWIVREGQKDPELDWTIPSERTSSMLAWAPDGTTLTAVLGEDIAVFAVKTLTVAQRLYALPSSSSGAAVLADGRLLLSGDDAGAMFTCRVDGEPRSLDACPIVRDTSRGRARAP